jgi:hypothetical protein
MSSHAGYFPIDIPYGTCTGFIKAEREIIFSPITELAMGLQGKTTNKHTYLRWFFREEKRAVLSSPIFKEIKMLIRP